MLKPVEVDLEVHKAIEARRLSFAESQNDILKRTLCSDQRQPQIPASDSGPREKPSRRGGSYELTLSGKKIACRSLKEVLKAAMLGIEGLHSGFLDKLAGHRTVRGRRIVARKPEELYPGKPSLVENCAERLDARWWYDTNVSFNQTRRYLRTMKDMSGIKELGVEQK
jgi:hypothetical protein